MGSTTDLKRIKEHVGGFVPLHMAGSPRNSLGEISHCPVAVYFRLKAATWPCFNEYARQQNLSAARLSISQNSRDCAKFWGSTAF